MRIHGSRRYEITRIIGLIIILKGYKSSTKNVRDNAQSNQCTTVITACDSVTSDVKAGKSPDRRPCGPSLPKVMGK